MIKLSSKEKSVCKNSYSYNVRVGVLQVCAQKKMLTLTYAFSNNSILANVSKNVYSSIISTLTL